MRGGRRHEHGERQREREQAQADAGREGEAAEQLGGAGQERARPGERDAERAEVAREALEAGAAERAEQLLRAVEHEHHRQHQADHEQAFVEAGTEQASDHEQSSLGLLRGLAHEPGPP